MLDRLAEWAFSRRVVGFQESELTDRGKEFTVHKGERYRALIYLNWAESFVGNDYIASQFQSVGFVDVKVAGSGSRRVAEGRWARDDTTAEIDPHITQISVLV